MIDLYRAAGRERGLEENTIYGNASGGSCFLLAMQNRGYLTLEDITEEDAMSFFTDKNGFATLSSGYKKEIAAVFQADLGAYTEPARRVLAYLPMIRPKRKNIPYLTPEEVDAIHRMLADENNELSLRNRAIGLLLFFTGIRGFSDSIERFVNYRKASGSWNEPAYGLNIKLFDHFCADNYPDKELCQEMVDTWCEQRETENNRSCYTRTLVIRGFIDYLRKRKLTDVVPAISPKPEKKKYIPHAFSNDELSRFFHECDSIIPYKGRPASVLRRK